MKSNLFLFLCAMMVALGCHSCRCRGGHAASDDAQGDTLRMNHAQLLTMVVHDGYTVVDIANPWNEGERLQRYVLVGRDKSDENLPEGVVVRVPLERSIPFSEVHAALIIELDRKESIVGLADVMYYGDPEILAMVKGKDSKGVADVGLSANPNVERIIDIAPDAMLVSPFKNSGGYGKLEQMGVPLIECADYMESSPLGRAEWIRFYGLLYGAETKADSIFTAVETNYNRLKKLAEQTTPRPTVMMDRMTGSTWYMPGGASTMGQLLADAGMRYIFADEASSGSLPLSFESVLDRCAEADIWLFRHNISGSGGISYDQLLAENDGYALFKPFKQRRCYGCHTTESRFFIETPFHPDRLLANLIAIVQPHLTNETNNKYFIRIRE